VVDGSSFRSRERTEDGDGADIRKAFLSADLRTLTVPQTRGRTFGLDKER
jgi:hypothetical protein